MAGRISHSVRKAILSRSRCFELLLRPAPIIRCKLPLFDRFFHRLAIFVVDRVERQFAFALHRLLVERVSLKRRLDIITRSIMPAVHPRKNLKRFSSDQHFAFADDRPSRLVDDFGGDLVTVILIAVNFFGEGRVDLNLDRAVF